MIYHLNIVINTNEIVDHLEHLWENCEGGYECPYEAMAEYIDLDWPNHEIVMKEISLCYPSVAFELETKFWKKIFINGEMTNEPVGEWLAD